MKTTLTKSAIARSALLLSMISLCLLSACGTNGTASSDGTRSYQFNGYRGGEFKKVPGVRLDNRGANRRSSNERQLAYSRPMTLHTNTRMEWSPDLEKKLTAMEEVKQAKAVVTESHVYVAVELEDDSKQADNWSALDSKTAGNLREAPLRVPADPGIKSGIAGNAADIQESRSSAPQKAQGMAQKGVGEDGEKLYSASPGADLSNMPVSVKQNIINQVKEWSPSGIQHVFVSANDQFRAQMENLRKLADLGFAMDKQTEVLNNAASRFFPDLQGTGSYDGSTSSGRVSRPRDGGEGMYSPSTGVRQK